MTDEGISKRSHATTRAQRAQFVERFHQSGLSRAAFAQRQGLPVWKLNRWLAEAKRSPKLAPPMVFSELRLRPLVSPVSVSWAMEVVSANGLTIRCREMLPVEELIRVLRG